MPESIAIADGTLRAEFSTRGAELRSLRRADLDVEYLWQGDPAVWNRRAPILFPIVGRLRNDRCVVGGTAYRLPQHGFARDREFFLTERRSAAATFALRESSETLACYPFRFRLEITYTLHGGALLQRVEVGNPGDAPMLFSLGLHPGFGCPLVAGESLEDYAVEFEHAETADRFPVIDGLVSREGEPYLAAQRSLPLRAKMFDRGAIVFKGLHSRRVRLAGRSGRGVELSFSGFPYFGIWSKPGGGFVCLEPWCGIADPPDACGQLEDKEGVLLLAPGETFRRELRISPF